MANWLKFDQIENWDFLIIPGFQYDEIPDAHVTEALCDMSRLAAIDTSLDWEDDEWLMLYPGIPESRKHAYRVAALVHAFQSGDVMREPISLDTVNVYQCCSAIGNGHHRIRALQYLGLTSGPFSLSGEVRPLKDLVRLAGVLYPEDASKYCAKELLLSNVEDIKVRKPRVKSVEGAMA